jgi:aspartate racemase
MERRITGHSDRSDIGADLPDRATASVVDVKKGLAMTKHIGIVACSAEGAALCYRTICAEGSRHLGPHAHPEVSMHTHSLADYVACLDRGDIAGIGDLMLWSAFKFHAAGADFLISPDTTVHQAMDHVTARSPLPWLHVAEVLAAAAAANRYRRLALLGTPWLMESDVYPVKLQAHGIACIRPEAVERQRLGEIIMTELVYGEFEPESIAYIEKIIARLKEEGCDAVALACTELPLILSDANSALPTLDSTRLLARAALAHALADHRHVGSVGRP